MLRSPLNASAVTHHESRRLVGEKLDRQRWGYYSAP
jgi:hypothetical protein